MLAAATSQTRRQRATNDPARSSSLPRQADLENGLWAGNNRVNPDNVPLNYPFVMAMVKGGANGFALKGADATQGKLGLMYDGPRPAGYQPMKKQGAIILGIGGDNSDSATGIFFEGAITAGYSTDVADEAVHQDISACHFPAPPAGHRSPSRCPRHLGGAPPPPSSLCSRRGLRPVGARRELFVLLRMHTHIPLHL